MTDTAVSAVDVRALTKRFGGGAIAVDGIDLTIPRGSITGLIGANGSGKTTLMQILAGVLRPDGGWARVLGRDPLERADVPGISTTYVAQAAELDPEMTGRDTLRLFATLLGVAQSGRECLVGELGATFELGSHLDRPVATYSGGLRQRLHLAIGFLQVPDLALLDEPTAALDPAGRAAVWRLCQSLRDDSRTVVLITHDLLEASMFCQNVVLLHRGRVAAAGLPAELVAQYGAWTLDIRFAAPMEQDAALIADLGSVVGLSNVEMKELRLAARFRTTDASAAQRAIDSVIKRIDRDSRIVLGYRLDPPDLASAYLNLTGSSVTVPERATARRNGGRRDGQAPSSQPASEA